MLAPTLRLRLAVPSFLNSTVCFFLLVAMGLNCVVVAAMIQWSQSAYRYGDYVAKLALFPIGKEQLALHDWRVKESDPANVLATSLQDFHAKHEATYSLRVQLCQNLKEQSVEDIGIEWDEQKYPFEEVAVLTFPKQESWDPVFRNWWDDKITCNTWHGRQFPDYRDNIC